MYVMGRGIESLQWHGDEEMKKRKKRRKLDSIYM
jgi:hypothetical protein